jgi:hypothetical protein
MLFQTEANTIHLAFSCGFHFLLTQNWKEAIDGSVDFG